MYQKRNEKRKKSIEKRNQEEGREEEQEEEIRRGLSNRKYVSSCIIKTRLSHFTHYSFTIYRWIKDAGCRIQKTTTENNREPEQEHSCEKR